MSRIESQVGVVGTVDDVPAGGDVSVDHAAGATELALTDASDFAEDGGQVTVLGEVLDYTRADLATDVLHLASPLPVAVESATAVHVHPYSPSRVATVTVEGRTDGLTVRVPQSLLDQVPTGLRSEETAETVVVDLVDGQWQLVDLVAVPSRAMDADTVQQIVMDSADGFKQQSFRFVDATPAPLPDPPTTEGRREGDSHHDVTTGSGVVRAAYVLTGDGQWAPHRFGDEVLDSVSAGKLLGGVITALLRLQAQGELIVGHEHEVHVRIRDGRVDIMHPGEPGEEARPYISMGKGADGAFRVLDADGGVLGGIMPDGGYEGPRVDTNELTVDGTSLDERLAPLTESLGRFQTPPGVVYGPKSVDMALIEVTADVPANSTLILDVHGWLRANVGGLSILRCSYNSAPAGTTPPRPTGASPEIEPGMPVAHTSTAWFPAIWRWTLGIGPEDRRVRALIWVERSTGGDPSAANFTVLPSIARVRGASGFAGVIRTDPGSGGSSPLPAPPLAERTERFDLGPHSLWVGSTRAVSGYRMGDVQAGRSASGQLWDTAILLPAAARNAIAASEELVSARVRLAQSVYPTTIRPHIGTIQTTNITGTRAALAPRNIGQGSRTYTPAKPSGWTVLAATTLTALKAGDPGLWIPNLGSGQAVGRFHGPGASGGLRPQIEITTRSRT